VASQQGLPHGGSTRFYGGSTRWQGHLGRFTGLRLRRGRIRKFLPLGESFPAMGRDSWDMHSGPSDQVLLLAVTERDMDAFQTLYERHAGWLAIRLARRCNDRDLVADAIQDTFVAVWQRPQGFRGEGDIAAWLWGIAIRRLVSRLRTRSGVAAVFEKAEAAPAAEEQVLLSVEYGDIGQALARLSPEMRAVIQAVVLDGLTAKEAASLLHVPVSSVKTRLYRAKAHLRAALAEGSS
jgi:RNA polymerase sigma factor (sigma-70 family)